MNRIKTMKTKVLTDFVSPLTFIDPFVSDCDYNSNLQTLQVIQIRISCEVGTMTFCSDIILERERERERKQSYTLSMLIHTHSIVMEGTYSTRLDDG